MAEASDDDESGGQQVVVRQQAPPPGADAPLPPEVEAKRREVLGRMLGGGGEQEMLLPGDAPPQPLQKGEGIEAPADGELQQQQQPEVGLAAVMPLFASSVRTSTPGSCHRPHSAALWLQAAGAGKALGASLWGWGASLASRVEAAAASVGRELSDTVHDAQPAVQVASRWVGWLVG